jgi:hypothetical protein
MKTVIDIIPILQEVIRLMSEQTFSEAPKDPEYCDSLCCSRAQSMLENLVVELTNN